MLVSDGACSVVRTETRRPFVGRICTARLRGGENKSVCVSFCIKTGVGLSRSEFRIRSSPGSKESKPQPKVLEGGNTNTNKKHRSPDYSSITGCCKQQRQACLDGGGRGDGRRLIAAVALATLSAEGTIQCSLRICGFPILPTAASRK